MNGKKKIDFTHKDNFSKIGVNGYNTPIDKTATKAPETGQYEHTIVSGNPLAMGAYYLGLVKPHEVSRKRRRK